MRILQVGGGRSGQPELLAQGLRRLGHQVQVWHDGEAPGCPGDRIVRDETPASGMRTFCDALDEDFDVLHFHSGRSLVPSGGGLPEFWDLPVWRALGKRLVFSVHDQRQVEARLQVVRAYADQMTVDDPLDLVHIPDAVYLPLAVDTGALPFVGPVNRSRPVVVHAPGQATEGTDLVLAALETLRQRGVAFELDLVDALPHQELMARLARADVVVEKVIAGAPGVLALTAMAMGKTAVTRLRSPVLEAHPGLPAISVDPDTVVDVLEKLLQDPDRRRALAAPGRSYVESEHALEVVARRLDHLYTQPGRSVLPVFPGWTTPGARDKVAKWQERVQRVEARNAALAAETAQLRGSLDGGVVSALAGVGARKVAGALAVARRRASQAARSRRH